MDFLSKLKKIVVKIEKRQNSIFSYPLIEQKSFLNHFPEPIDEIERSYFQYRCQMKLYSIFLCIFINLVSFPLYIYFLLRLVEEPSIDIEVDAVFFPDGKSNNIIPKELENEYESILRIDSRCESFTRQDRNYILSVWKRYPFDFQFLLKNLIKIRYYSYEISCHNPKSIIVCNEYSFTSSLLTSYCRTRGIKHINVMHGEKLFFIRDSFFKFDRCYVWNSNYSSLFVNLRADPNQFVCAVPPSLKFNISDKVINKEIDYTYYLAAEDDERTKLIAEYMNELAESGFKVAIRPHPRYSNIDIIKRFGKKVQIEDNSSLSIEISVLRTKHAISSYSTVLNQAFNNGTLVVIDDLTNREAFNKLNELNYVMLELNHILFSSVINQIRTPTKVR